MEQPVEMPFDGARMIYAGFDILGESGSESSDKAGYVHGYVAPVKMDQRQPFADMCQTVREVALDCGALRAVDSLAADVAEGKITDFNRAVNADAEGDEAIAFGVTQWASREAYEQGAIKMQEDKRMPSGGPNMPMDGKRMIHGGFKVILDTK